MADTQTSSTPKSSVAEERGGRPREDAPMGVGAEKRAFAPVGHSRGPNEPVGVARDISMAAAEATKEVAERTRETAREVAAGWRSAVEPLLSMQMEMNRWFDDLWRQAVGRSAFPILGVGQLMTPRAMPPTDVRETDDAYLISAELPGASRDQIDVQMRGDRLTLCGHKAEEKESLGFAHRVSERRLGRFERDFVIPSDVDRQRIAATLRDGILTLTLPKTPEAARSSVRVEITV